MLEKLYWFCLTDVIALLLIMWKWMGLLLRKNHLWRCWGWLSLLNWIGVLIYIAKAASKKIGASICTMKFLSSEVVLCLYISTIRSCVEYCCNAWIGAPSRHLELLDKLQKRICRTVGPSLTASLEHFTHRQNLTSVSLFYRYYVGDPLMNWPNWFHFLILEGRILVILIDCMIFLSPFLDVT